MTIIEMRDKRAKLLATMDGFLDTHRDGKGVLSAEDDATYTGMEKELAAIEYWIMGSLKLSSQYAGMVVQASQIVCIICTIICIVAIFASLVGIRSKDEFNTNAS